MSLPLWPA